MPEPIELRTDHRCVLGEVTDRLAQSARAGKRGDALAADAREALAGLDRRFAECCEPVYLALAPEQFDREVQLPIACADDARLDTRVLLWPVSAQDGQHPHCEGWAAFMPTRGALTVAEEREHTLLPERALSPGSPEIIYSAQDVSHHIHNRGGEVGLTIHVFGV
jgi:hypothetical protein